MKKKVKIRLQFRSRHAPPAEFTQCSRQAMNDVESGSGKKRVMSAQGITQEGKKDDTT